jgi:hypothetical protein
MKLLLGFFMWTGFRWTNVGYGVFRDVLCGNIMRIVLQ